MTLWFDFDLEAKNSFFDFVATGGGGGHTVVFHNHPLDFYTPIFRRDVWWYGDVRPGLRPSGSPSARVCTFLLHALTYWAEILHMTLF